MRAEQGCISLDGACAPIRWRDVLEPMLRIGADRLDRLLHIAALGKLIEPLRQHRFGFALGAAHVLLMVLALAVDARQFDFDAPACLAPSEYRSAHVSSSFPQQSTTERRPACAARAPSALRCSSPLTC